MALCLPLLTSLPHMARADSGTPVLRVLAWPGYAEPEVVKAFETRTRARVELTTVDTDEAQWQKITDPSGPGFDVFAVNTAELQRYLASNRVQPIDTTRIPGTLNFSHCSSDSSAATTGTYVVPTGFPATIPVKSGRTYRVEVVGFYQCAATTYAPRHRLQYPTLTAGSITMDSFSAASTNTQTGSAVTLGASSQTFVSAAAGAANTSYLFRLDGFIIPSADGNLIYDFTPNAAGTMRIMADTFISVTEVG